MSIDAFVVAIAILLAGGIVQNAIYKAARGDYRRIDEDDYNERGEYIARG